MNKGFTLIEVLASIIVIGLILVITIPSYLYVYNTVKETNYKNKVTVIKQRAVDYGETIKDEIQETGCRTVLISDLIKKGYINSDYTNKDALTNPMDNQEFKDNFTLCYCPTDNNLRAYMLDTFDPHGGYVKGQEVEYNGVRYEAISTYDYYNIMNEMSANKDKKVESRNSQGEVIYVNAPCQGYYNGELDLCVIQGTNVNADYLINHFFKMTEC